MAPEYYQQILSKVKYGTGDSDKHLLTMFTLSVSINAQRILELGVRTGNTTLPFLLAAKETGGLVHSVDLEPTVFSCPDDLKTHWNFYQSDAIQWLQHSVNESAQYDLIYVDDWHAYDHVKQELALIDSMISPNGLILIHDLMSPLSCPNYHSDVNTTNPQWANGGPYRAVAELDPEKWEWSTIPVGWSLTILRKKSGIIFP